MSIDIQRLDDVFNKRLDTKDLVYLNSLESHFLNMNTHKLFFLTCRWTISQYDKQYAIKANRYMDKIAYALKCEITDRKKYNRSYWKDLSPELYCWLDIPGKGRDSIKDVFWHHHGVVAVHKDTMDKFRKLYEDPLNPEMGKYRLQIPERYCKVKFFRDVQAKPIKVYNESVNLVSAIEYASRWYRLAKPEYGFSVYK